MHLVMLFGPPAVGKMTVGREIARRTTYRLFHNHATIEPLLEVFDWGTEPFQRLTMEFRTRIIEEAISSGLPGLVFTVVWALEQQADTRSVEELIAPVLATGGRVDFVELWSAQDTRLAREGTAERLAAKASKRDVGWARANLLEWGRTHVLSTGDDQAFPLDHPHVRIDNDDLTPATAAERIIEHLALPRVPSGTLEP
ncbi:AAA family ATPase [soil metagenome]